MPKLTHQQARHLLHASLDSPLPAARQAELDAHLATCEACRRYAEQISHLESDLRRVMHARWDGQEADIPIQSVRVRLRRLSIQNNIWNSVKVIGVIAIVIALLVISINWRSNLLGIPSKATLLESTPTSTAPVPLPTNASRPFPNLAGWDLLIISDTINFGVGEYYAKLIEADIGVKVNLHDCLVSSLSIQSVLHALQRGGQLFSYKGGEACLEPWPDLVKEAEVMVLFGNPLDSSPPDGSWNIPETYHKCVEGGYQGKNLEPGFETYKAKMLKSCAPETFAMYKADLGAVLDEIDKIREGRPLILRMTNFYVPLHSKWAENGIEEVCTICVGNFAEAIRQVAAEHGVPVADTMAGLNGEDYMSDPVEDGYIGPDGKLLSNAGAQFVAKLLEQTGYEYAGK